MPEAGVFCYVGHGLCLSFYKRRDELMWGLAAWRHAILGSEDSKGSECCKRSPLTSLICMVM